jgi:hypothetical protein
MSGRKPYTLVRVSFLVALIVCTAPASAELRIEVGYSKPADLFSLMDHVSLWSPDGFSKPEYREYWEAEFGWSAEDQQWADRYREYRERTYSDPGQAEQDPATASDGLFAKRSSVAAEVDPLATRFTEAASVSEALADLEAFAGSKDGEMLAGFYAHFEPRWSVVLAESSKFATRVDELQGALRGNAVDAYLKRVSAFYGVDIDRDFQVRFVWWPPIDRTGADITGRTFFIRSHPVYHAEDSGWDEIVMHELTHYVSAHQSNEQKQALTARFLEACPAQIETGFYQLLEEPLAVAFGNAAFAKFGRGEPLDPADNWYWMPTPSIMGRLLWDDVERLYPTDATIRDGLIDQAAEYCRQILQIAQWMSPIPDREAADGK